MTHIIKLKRLPHALEIPVPFYATEGSAGADVSAALNGSSVHMEPGARALIPTGFQAEIPKGYEMQIRSRSGLAYKNGVIVLNSPATIDSDYRGEIKVLLMNLGEEPFLIEHGMRIAQILIASALQMSFAEYANITKETHRDEEGFGSTGL
jgi:dUTP pyrophosphatase